MHGGIAYLRWRGKRSRHSRRMRTRNFAYLARGPWHTRLHTRLLDLPTLYGLTGMKSVFNVLIVILLIPLYNVSQMYGAMGSMATVSHPPLCVDGLPYSNLLEVNGDEQTLNTRNIPSCRKPICQSCYVLVNNTCLQCLEKTSDNPTFIKAESYMLLLVFRSDKSFEKFKRH